MSNPVATAPHAGHHQSFWLWVMCLTGVDYFSTLGYQPSIAFESAGMLAPLATVVLVLVTLFGALPVYAYVASKSHEGQGSIGMLANLVSGWVGKVLVLSLLGFAATDFVITKTLSAADAAVHLIENPHWPLRSDDQTAILHQRLLVTGLLLVLLGASFMRGFREVIGLAAVIVGVYLALNFIVIGAGLFYLNDHPGIVNDWWTRVTTGNWYLADPPVTASGGLGLLLLVLLIFPKLALGLSGFETGVAVMPLIKGSPNDTPSEPRGRIRNTRKLLITAAVIMSICLLGSSLLVSAIIPPRDLIVIENDRPVAVDWDHPEPGQQLPAKPRAKDRALAYIAHGEGPAKDISPLFGETFGTIYDLSTIVILWFAGASAMAGLLNLVPKYLPRYGMAPEWARAIRPLVLLFTLINLLVTWVFKADVSAQGGAYATGVLVLITSACVATVIEKWRSSTGAWPRRVPWAYSFITAVFVYTTVAVVIEKPEGIKIAACFIAAILGTSLASRVRRSRELRFQGFHIPDPESKFLWDSIRHLEVSVLVPHRPGRRSLIAKEAIIRREHRIPRDVMMVFVEVELADPSEFVNEPQLTIKQEEERFVMKIRNAASIAHTLAAVALEMGKVGRPPEIHFGWTDESPVSGTLGFLLFGEGNVPWMVRELVHRAEPDDEKRPLIVIAGK
jgi:hypothetical protein